MTRRLLMTADSVGGVWQYATELARALQPRGYDVTIATLGPPASATQRATLGSDITLLDTGLPLDWTASDAAAVLETGAAIARLAEQHGADVVQVNQPAFAAAAFTLPVVATAHSCVGTWWQAMFGAAPEPADFAWQTDLMQRGLESADRVVAPSHAFAAALQQRYRLTTAPNVVHNGRAAFELPPKAPEDAAFTAGRLWDDAKNVATLDRAAARLAIPFRAAGAQRNAKGQFLALDHLELLGQLDDAGIAEHLAARPIFVSAARYEPFGLAVLEAALAGCALVLSDIPTFRELWSGAAIFVDAEDDAGFAAAVAELVAGPADRRLRGTLARRRALEFTPVRLAAAMDALFDGAVAARAKVAA
ncbi:glycosyltransferase family 4 protein [Sphingomonas sp. 179-I 2A4 NHS]|uniref:glycosyltransferase family 4 protein n=1 Tax=unclassified Sphingomonas TaxID=196159 RepID=UPI0038795FE2